jgi:CO/xanthine dehydrogenase Mo-binding subunit
MKDRAMQIGQSVPRVDAAAKASGRERYAVDYYGDGLLWLGLKRAGIPSGRIRSIHTEKASSLDGVKAVLTFKDIKGTNRQGVIRKDQPVLANDKIRHAGDPLALVIAESKDIIQHALKLIEIEVEPLPPVLDPEAALLKDAPIIHEDNPNGNALLRGVLSQGDAPAAFEKCDVTIEKKFRLGYQEHAYLETEAGWAIMRDSGRIEIVCSTQTPFRDRSEVAAALGLDMSKIRIITTYCGGGFGGKDGVNVQSLLALAALHAHGRPVKMWWDREDSFLASCKRHPATLKYRLGAASDGTLKALDVRMIYDTGPYDHLGGAVLALAMEHAGGPYRISDTRIEACAVYTNNPIAGAFRGFGVPQVAAAMEQMVDILAAKCGIDPIRIRIMNAVAKGDKNSIGVTMACSTGILECLETLQKDPAWIDRENWKSQAGPFKSRGIGIAAAMHGMGYGPVIPDTANAKIELTAEGRFRIYCGVVDMGQGNASTFLQIAGDILNQGIRNLELVLPDTDRTLPSGSSSASRTTYTFGNALISASGMIKDRILNRMSDLMMAKGVEELTLVPGAIRHLLSGREIPLSEAARFMMGDERIVIARFRAPVSAEMPTSDPSLRNHGIPHVVFSHTAHLAGIEVDHLTGCAEVLKYVAVSDCGRIINPQLFEQQMHGGISQGIGYALYEDFLLDNGLMKTKDLSTYIIPTSLDIPDMKSKAVELTEHTGPFGMKGSGEIAIDAPLPAIANAIADACQVRLEAFPLTPERILGAMNKLEIKGGGC